MDKVNTLFSVLAYVVVATLGAASIFALFRSRYIKTTVDELRNDRDDQAKRIERLESERDELREGNVRRDAIIDSLKSQNETLKEALSGKAQLDHLQRQLDAHDKRVDQRHDALTASMLSVVVSNESLNERVAELLGDK
jgi:F0F1-type ATP synthase membrane subunit b/b'